LTEYHAIGIDIGATKIASVLLAENGRVLASSQTSTAASEGKDAVLDRVAAQIQELTDRSPATIAGIGVGSPGKVDSSLGIVHDAVNLAWKEVPLTQEISNRLPVALPIWVQKDTNLSALGEYYFGACQGCNDFVYLGVGSGLGAGIISNGQLITGADWYAADVGHLSLDPDGPPCVCGGRGCAELIASGPGLLRVVRRLLTDPSAASMLSGQAELTPAEVLDAAEQGDALARQALAEVGHVLGVVMSACTVLLNPVRFVIGGGLGLAGFDFIMPTVWEELKRRTLPNHRGQMEIVRSQLESPAIGAACLVWYARAGRISMSSQQMKERR
jgi:glucokinase